MLERTMKSFRAAVVFLALSNLLTVSSNTSTNENLTASENHVSSTASIPWTLNSHTEQGKDETKPTIASNPSTITEDDLHTSTSRSRNISNVSRPTASTVDSPSVHTTDDMKDVHGNTVATDKMSTASQKEEKPSVGAATTKSNQVHVSHKESSTESDHETQTTKPAITNKVQAPETEDSNTFSDNDKKQSDVNDRVQAPETEDSNTFSDNDKKQSDVKDRVQAPETEDSNKFSDNEKQQSDASNRGIKIGVGCVAAFIALIVLVVIYKMCQKKPPTVENTGVKMSAETKENVKLLSVKTEAPNSDTKRASSNQMESIEC